MWHMVDMLYSRSTAIHKHINTEWHTAASQASQADNAKMWLTRAQKVSRHAKAN